MTLVGLHLAWFAYEDPSSDHYGQNYEYSALMASGTTEIATSYLTKATISPVTVLVFVGNGYAEDFGWPVPGYSMSSITTTYYYSNGAAHSCRYHYNGRAAGIDIAVSTGTQVFAVADGTVQSIEDKGNTSFGRYFEIKHNKAH